MQGRCPSSECHPQCVQQARCGRVRRFKRGCHHWQIKHGSECLASATSLYSSEVFLLWRFACDARLHGAPGCAAHDAPQPSTIYDLALTGNPTPGRGGSALVIWIRSICLGPLHKEANRHHDDRDDDYDPQLCSLESNLPVSQTCSSDFLHGIDQGRSTAAPRLSRP